MFMDEKNTMETFNIGSNNNIGSNEIFTNGIQQGLEGYVNRGELSITVIPKGPWYKRLFKWLIN